MLNGSGGVRCELIHIPDVLLAIATVKKKKAILFIMLCITRKTITIEINRIGYDFPLQVQVVKMHFRVENAPRSEKRAMFLKSERNHHGALCAFFCPRILYKKKKKKV